MGLLWQPHLLRCAIVLCLGHYIYCLRRLKSAATKIEFIGQPLKVTATSMELDLARKAFLTTKNTPVRLTYGAEKVHEVI